MIAERLDAEGLGTGTRVDEKGIGGVKRRKGDWHPDGTSERWPL
jgi:hypothetical protein